MTHHPESIKENISRYDYVSVKNLAENNSKDKWQTEK